MVVFRILKIIAGLCLALTLRLFAINMWRPVSTPMPALPVFSSDDSRLTGMIEKIGIDDLIGPESVIASKAPGDGTNVMFASLADGRVVRIEEQNMTCGLSWTTLVRTGSVPLSDTSTCGRGGPSDTTNTEGLCGRPLGMKIVKRSTVDPNTTTITDEDVLVVADGYNGLLMITDIYGENSELRTLAVRANTDPTQYRFRLLNALVQTQDGALYITETSQEFERRRIFHAVLKGKSTGRLLRYTKESGIEVVVEGLYMPNGISISHDGKHLLFVAGIQVLKYSLEKQEMEKETFIHVLPGTGDNIDSKQHLPSGSKKDCYWLGLGSKFSQPFSLLKLLSEKPFMKALVTALVPYKIFVNLIPKFSALAVYDVNGALIEVYRDENVTAPWLSEGEEMGDHLYLGSWFNNFLARVKIEDLNTKS